MSRARAPWRVHLPFAGLVVLGVAVRVVVMVAYRPALMLTDSFGYLALGHNLAISDTRPAGYPLFLWPILHVVDSRAAVVGVQHFLGVALAVACYAFLVRRGLPWWGASLAVLPVLFDPLQLVLEHYVLSDLLFEVGLVTACLVVLWRQRPGVPEMLLGGLLVAACAVTRGAGTFLLVVFVIGLLCLRVRWTRLVAFVLAFAFPVIGYMLAFHARYGEYATASSGPRFLYSRLAPIVSCQDLVVPPYEQRLCPSEPIGRRQNSDWYMWGGKRGPQYQVPPPPGMTQLHMVEDWDKRVLRAQPLPYARVVLVDWARGFAPLRTYQIVGYPAKRWLFHDHNWALDEFVQRHILKPRVLEGQSSDRAAARFLTGYRHWLWTPGPLLALLLAVAVAAAAGVRRARCSGDRVAVGLLAATCVLPLLTSAALSSFSWRYQLPQVPLLPMAGALGLAAILRGRAVGRRVDPPIRLPALVATGLGVVVGLVVGAGAAHSGWAARSTAAVAGLVVAVLVAGALLGTRGRRVARQ